MGIFLNETEKRLRSGWRILLFIAGLLVISFILNSIIKFVFGSPPEDITIKDAIRGVIVIFMATLAVWPARKFLDKKTFISLGLRLDRWAGIDIIAGLLLSGLMILAIFLIQLYAGYLTIERITWTDDTLPVVPGLLLWFFSIGAAVAWSEELIFRGYLLQNLRDGIGLYPAVAISCLLFGVLHMSNPNSSWLSGLIITLFTFLPVYAWLRTGQLWLSMGIHAGWNFFQGPVFGFPVSGLEKEKLISQHLEGPEWITGGAFGLEASIIILPVILAGLMVIYLWTRSRKGTSGYRLNGQ